MNRFRVIILTVILVLALAAVYFYLASKQSESVVSPTPSPTLSQASIPSSLPSQPETKPIKSSDIADAHSDYNFAATVPNSWETEAVTSIDSINFYDPTANGANNLEKSQIFIRKFSGNGFLTLQTVTIHDRKELTIAGRPSVRYDIEKKADVVNFPNQPSWRNERHIVTDIRVSDINPSVFYVIAKRPDLAGATYQDFLSSLTLGDESDELTTPTEDFKARITKKKFGQQITKENSPVSPERFSGYHTGVAVEFSDTTTDVPVRAVADGTVIHSVTASGYGGVLAIQHTINDEPIIGIYGHLDPKSMKAKGTSITRAEQVAILGEGNTAETDGERKHLHFGLVKGQTLNRKGYVQSQTELTSWLDPLSVYQ